MKNLKTTIAAMMIMLTSCAASAQVRGIILLKGLEVGIHRYQQNVQRQQQVHQQRLQQLRLRQNPKLTAVAVAAFRRDTMYHVSLSETLKTTPPAVARLALKPLPVDTTQKARL